MKTLDAHLQTILAPLDFIDTVMIQDLADALNDHSDERIQKRLKYQPPVKLELTERRHRGEKIRINDTFSVAFEKRFLLLCFNENPVVDQAEARRLTQFGMYAHALDRDERVFLMPSRGGTMLVRNGVIDKTNVTTASAWTLVPTK